MRDILVIELQCSSCGGILKFKDRESPNINQSNPDYYVTSDTVRVVATWSVDPCNKCRSELEVPVRAFQTMMDSAAKLR